MPETFSVISPPAGAQTDISPGVGSTAFTSGGVAYASSAQSLTATPNLVVLSGTAASSASVWIQSSNLAGLATNSGALIVGLPGQPSLGVGSTAIQCRSAAAGAANLTLQPNGGDVFLGASSAGGQLVFRSTVTVSTAVGVAGAAEAPPATPEQYLKVRIPNAAHTITTLLIPAYLE